MPRSHSSVSPQPQIGQAFGEAKKRGEIGRAHLDIERNAAPRQFFRRRRNAVLQGSANPAETLQFPIPVERVPVRGAVAYDHAYDVRAGVRQLRAIHYQDGAIEAIARQDGVQMRGRMVLGKTDVGVYAQAN
jgi:hypothetical protein